MLVFVQTAQHSEGPVAGSREACRGDRRKVCVAIPHRCSIKNNSAPQWSHPAHRRSSRRESRTNRRALAKEEPARRRVRRRLSEARRGVR